MVFDGDGSMMLHAVESQLNIISDRKSEWSSLPYGEKVKILEEMYRIFSNLDHEAWARDSLEAQGYDTYTLEVDHAVEMIVNTSIIGQDLRMLIEVYKSLRDKKEPPILQSRTIHCEEKNVDVVDVYPRIPSDKQGPTGDWKVEVWMKDGNSVAQVAPRSEQRLCLLLAAGNQGMLAFCDALNILFVEGMTCIVKHNPVREYNHKWMQRIFEPLSTLGFFLSVTGGIQESKFLLAHKLIDHVHMTGGKITHDLIVWGDPRKREKKLLQKPITSELGTIAPYIIGPGEWDDKEVIHHARYFATVLMNNNGCNCMAPQVLILPETGFPVDKFLAALKGVMQQRPHAPPYYPGTKARYDSWVAGLESVS